MYESGFLNGGVPDHKKAVEYYQEAATKGHSTAMCHLGVRYDRGISMSLNQMLTIVWQVKGCQRIWRRQPNGLRLPLC